jgi:hypothetical protein
MTKWYYQLIKKRLIIRQKLILIASKLLQKIQNIVVRTNKPKVVLEYFIKELFPEVFKLND